MTSSLHQCCNQRLQALKQLSDIVNVWAVVDYSGTNSLARELVMCKVSYLPNTGDFRTDASSRLRPTYRALLDAQPHRAAVRDIGELFGAEVVDVGTRHIVFQLTSWSRRIDAFIKMVRTASAVGLFVSNSPHIEQYTSRHRSVMSSLASILCLSWLLVHELQLEPWGIIEVARSGVVAMLRSPVSGTESEPIQTPSQAGAAPDATALPPG